MLLFSSHGSTFYGIVPRIMTPTPIIVVFGYTRTSSLLVAAWIKQLRACPLSLNLIKSLSLLSTTIAAAYTAVNSTGLVTSLGAITLNIAREEVEKLLLSYFL